MKIFCLVPFLSCSCSSPLHSCLSPSMASKSITQIAALTVFVSKWVQYVMIPFLVLAHFPFSISCPSTPALLTNKCLLCQEDEMLLLKWRTCEEKENYCYRSFYSDNIRKDRFQNRHRPIIG